MKNSWVVILGALSLSACGGEGQAPSPTPTDTPTPQGSAPIYNGDSVFDVGENEVLIATLDFSDPDGDPITFDIAGGSDGGFFEIDSDARLTFIEPNNFEYPRDNNSDNIYAVEITATDFTGLATTQTIRVRVQDRTGSLDRRYVHYTLPGVFQSANVPFGSVNINGQQATLLLDAFLPSADTEERRPVIIFAFGGGFVQGNRDGVRDLAIDFARRGFVTATVDYRTLSAPPSNQLEYFKGAIDAIQDVAAAVRYFREDGLGPNLFGVDPAKIFVAGESAGGVIAASMATFDLDELEDGDPVKEYLIQTGGLAGRSSDNFDTVSSEIQGAISYSGGITDLAFIDETSAPLYAAHDEFDPIVPCDTGQEGMQGSGVVLSGGCDITARYEELSVPFGFFFIPNSNGHVDFDAVQLNQIAIEAGELFLATVIAPAPD